MALDLSVLNIPKEIPQDSEYKFTLNGVSFNTGVGRHIVSEAIKLGVPNLTELTEEEAHNIIDSYSRNPSSTNLARQLDNSVSAALKNNIRGTFPYNKTFEVIANPNYTQELLIPIDCIGKYTDESYFIREGAAINLPFAQIFYSESDVTNFINCPIIVAQNTDIDLV